MTDEPLSGGTLLLRQINPSWLRNGRPTSQAFKPTRKDGKQLSFYDGDMVTPEESWRHYTEELGYASAGTMGITVDECDGFTVKRKPEDFPAHVVIDFSENSGSEVRTAGRLLAKRARDRGWLYVQPTEEG